MHRNIPRKCKVHFSYYTSMTFLMMLSVILLSILMILLSILTGIRHLICGNNLNWLLILNLRDTVDWEKKWPVDFNAGKTQLVFFDWPSNGSIDVKIDGSVFKKKSSFKMLGLTFSKTASKKIGALFVL